MTTRDHATAEVTTKLCFGFASLCCLYGSVSYADGLHMMGHIASRRNIERNLFLFTSMTHATELLNELLIVVSCRNKKRKTFYVETVMYDSQYVAWFRAPHSSGQYIFHDLSRLVICTTSYFVVVTVALLNCCSVKVLV